MTGLVRLIQIIRKSNLKFQNDSTNKSNLDIEEKEDRDENKSGLEVEEFKAISPKVYKMIKWNKIEKMNFVGYTKLGQR